MTSNLTKRHKTSEQPASSIEEKRDFQRTDSSKKSHISYLFFVYASLAGACGALSGVVGKVAVAATSVSEIAKFVGFAANDSWALETVMRVIFFASNAFFTGQMWRYYIKSLSLGPTPVCQIINTGTNFAVSAFMGILFFGETINFMWCIGAFLVVLGLGVVVLGTRVPIGDPESEAEGRER